MRKKNLKKIIILLAVLVIIILIIINILNQIDRQGDDKTISTKISEQEENVEEPNINTKVQVEETDLFFATKSFIEKFLDYTYESDVDATIALLNTEWLNENNITKDNINKYISFGKLYKFYAVSETKIRENADFISIIVEGIKTDENTINSRELYCIDIDIVEGTAYLMPITDENIQQEPRTIKSNEYNSFEISNMDESDIADEYYEYYNYLLHYNAEEAYKLLNNEYREKRFSTIESFKEYISERKETDPILIKYSYQDNDNYKKYVLIDNYGHYYILNETTIMNFDIQLDAYTIRDENYVSNYNMLTDSEKISSNIELIMMMLNNKDYESIYNKLNEDFITINFRSVDELKKYFQTNLFNYNIFTSTNVKQEGDIYICNGIISSRASSAAEKKEISIVMKLKENADFEMSFKIK